MTNHPFPAISNPQITTSGMYSGDVIINLRELLSDIDIQPLFESWRPIIRTQFLFRSGKFAMTTPDQSNEIHLIVDEITGVTGNLNLSIPALSANDTIIVKDLPQIINSKVITSSALGSALDAEGFAINDIGNMTVRDNSGNTPYLFTKGATAPNMNFNFLLGYKTATFPSISGANISVSFGYDSEIDDFTFYNSTTAKLQITSTNLNITTGAVNFNNATISNILLSKTQIPSTTVYTDQANLFGSGFNQDFRSSRFRIYNPANTFLYTLVSGALTTSVAVNLPVLSANDTFAMLGITNTFTTWQKIQIDSSSTLVLYRPNNTVVAASGVVFNLQNSTASETAYAAVYGVINVNTAGAENGSIAFHCKNAGAMGEKMYINTAGIIGFGGTFKAQLDPAGLTASRIFTFQNASGTLPILEFTNVFTDLQTISKSAASVQLNLVRPQNTVGNSNGLSLSAWNSSNAEVPYAAIYQFIATNTAGAESGRLSFQVRQAGVTTERLSINLYPRFIVDSGQLNTMEIYRPVNTSGSNMIRFNMQSSTSVERTFGSMGARSETVTNGAEEGSINFNAMEAGTLVNQGKMQNGIWHIGVNNYLKLSSSGMSGAFTFTFPSLSGEVQTLNATQTVLNKTLTSPILNAGQLNGLFTTSAGLTLTRTSASSTAEAVQIWQISDTSISYISVDNASATDAVFSPRITSYNAQASTSSAVGFYLYSNIAVTSDTVDSVNAVTIFDSRRADGTTLQFKRPFQFRSGSTNLFEIYLDYFNFTSKRLVNATFNIDEGTNTIKHSTTNTQGDILYYDTTAGKYIRLARGADGLFLKVVSGNIAWAANTVFISSLDDIGDVNVTGVANGNILQFNGTNWVHSTIGTNGEANTAANVGAGAGTIFRDKTAAQLNFKTLVAGTDIGLTNGADTITIASTYVLPAAVVRTDQANGYGVFNQNFRSGTLGIYNPAATFLYQIAASAIVANRVLTLPLLSANDTFAFIGIDNSWSVQQTFLAASALRLRSADGAAFYLTLTQPTLAANRTLNIPAITGTDTVVTNDFAATLLSKTLTSPTINSGTLSGTFTLPATDNVPLIFSKPNSGAGTYEMLTKWIVDDASADYIAIENASNTAAVFTPLIRSAVLSAAHTASTNALYLQAIIKSTNDTTSVQPAIVLGAKNDNNTVIVNRPMLSILNFTTIEYAFYPTYMDFASNEIRNAIVHSSVTGIVNANIDGAAAIAITKIDTATLAKLAVANTFTEIQTISKNTEGILDLYKPINTAFTLWGIHFNANDSTSTKTTYAKILTSLEDNTDTSEDSYLNFQYLVAGTMTRRAWFYSNGLGLGATGASAFLSTSGLSADRTYTFQNATGTIPLLETANIFTAVQTIQNAAANLTSFYRLSQTANDTVGITLDAWSSTGVKRTYGGLKVTMIDVTNTSEDSNFSLDLMAGGTLGTKFIIHGNGNAFFGSNQRLVLVATNLTAQRLITFPNADSLVFGDGVDNDLLAHFLDIGEIAAPASPAANKLRLYMDNADEKLKTKNSSGVVTTLGSFNPIEFHKNWIYYYDDYLGAIGQSTFMIATNSGTGASMGTEASQTELNTFGTALHQTGTTSTGYAILSSSPIGGADLFSLGQGETTYITRVKTGANLGDATDKYKIRCGFSDLFGATIGVDAVTFEYDNDVATQWRCITRSNSVQTSTTGATAVAINTWYVLKIVVNAAGTSVAFYIDNALIATHTTNIPTGSGREVGLANTMVKYLGTTNRTMKTDYILFAIDLTTARAF